MELKPDERKWSHEEIENKPGRLGAQIIFNNLIKNDFYMEIYYFLNLKIINIKGALVS